MNKSLSKSIFLRRNQMAWGRRVIEWERATWICRFSGDWLNVKKAKKEMKKNFRWKLTKKCNLGCRRWELKFLKLPNSTKRDTSYKMRNEGKRRNLFLLKKQYRKFDLNHKWNLLNWASKKRKLNEHFINIPGMRNVLVFFCARERQKIISRGKKSKN